MQGELHVCQQTNDNSPVGARYSGEPHVFVSADTRKKSSFAKQGKKGKVLNLGHLDFDIVSDFDIRISDFASLGPLHLSRTLYKSALFMQNKPNFQKSQMNATSLVAMAYENIANWTLGENKPNSNPIKAKQTQSPSAIRNTQYEIRDTNPIKPNFKPGRD